MATTLKFMQWGQSVGIEPIRQQLLEDLARSFYTETHEYITDNQQGHRLARRGDPLFRVVDDPAGEKVVSVCRGLVPLVIERLRQRGYVSFPTMPPAPFWASRLPSARGRKTYPLPWARVHGPVLNSIWNAPTTLPTPK